jgi:hypothetical protein
LTSTFKLLILFFAATSLLVGTIVFGNANGIAGNSSSSLNTPWGITINVDNSIVIADTFNNRIVIVPQNSNNNATILRGGAQFSFPAKAIYDTHIPSNLYVLDGGTDRMLLYSNNLTIGVPLFGSGGSSLNQMSGPAGFYLSSNRSFYIADQINHRIMLWLWNASSGVVIAGQTGAAGNDTFHLNLPADIFVDEKSGQIYVADFHNHRIIRFTLGSLNGTVVAGGNGPGFKRK